MFLLALFLFHESVSVLLGEIISLIAAVFFLQGEFFFLEYVNFKFLSIHYRIHWNNE